MKRKTIFILWDASHIWGLMAWRGLRSLGIPCHFVKALEIAQGDCLGKRALGPESLLLVPGGNARQKALALGSRGREAIRHWVSEGGLYLGFCGGAGLALSDSDSSLGLCPLHRARFENRFYHFLSGHVIARTAKDDTLSLPVWWPGRFAYSESANFMVLARYSAPGSDLWLADLPLSQVPPDFLSSWARDRDLDPSLGFPTEEPLLIKGSFNKGNYILSYTHLETPDSPQANQWLCRLLQEYGGISPSRLSIPGWITTRGAAPEENPVSSFQKLLIKSHSKMLKLCKSARKIGLLFQREDWLLGWRSGFSGMPCNNLLATLSFLAEKRCPSPEYAFQQNFENCFEIFIQKAEEWLWFWKLESALHASSSTFLNEDLAQKQLEIFGNPMLGGGLIENLLRMLDEYIWFYQENLV